MAQALALLYLPTSPLPRRPAFTRNPRRHRPRPCLAAAPRNWSTPPETDCPVPPDQQPVNEYQSLSTSLPFSWATASLPDYAARLAVTGAAFALFIGLPVAAFGTGAVRDPQEYGLRCGLGAASAGLLAVTLAVLRMYLGWAYVGNRLLSATVEYEETGWYDGQDLKEFLSETKSPATAGDKVQTFSSCAGRKDVYLTNGPISRGQPKCQ